METRTFRLWVYVRDDQPFGGKDPPGAVYFYSADRAAIHPEHHLAGYSGILQADAYAGLNSLYQPDREAGAIAEAACWAHARRKFFELARRLEGTQQEHRRALADGDGGGAEDRCDLCGRASHQWTAAHERLALRRADVTPLVDELLAWMRSERAKLSRHNEVAKAMDYMLKRIEAFTRFLADGRICLSNNAAERALRGIALGRKAWLFAGFRPRRRARGRHVHADPDCQAQRRRSASLACRCARAHLRSQQPAA